MKEQILNKLTHLQNLYKSSIDRYLSSGLRKDRDNVLRYKYKIETYQEVLTLLPVEEINNN
jgi:hypothetical protein